MSKMFDSFLSVLAEIIYLFFSLKRLPKQIQLHKDHNMVNYYTAINIQVLG